MSKIEITRKDAKNFCDLVVQVGYCDLQNLLYNHAPEFYNAGVYGWNWDLYTLYIPINGITRKIGICTGYRSLCGYCASWETVNRYEKEAREANYDSQKIENLLQKFCVEVYNEATTENN